MKRAILWLMLGLVLIVPSLTLANSYGDQGLIVAAGETRASDISTFGQPIVINGVVEGDVTSVTGSIIVRGAVEGDVVSLFGDVTFEPDSVAEGNVMAAVGRVSVPETSQIAASGTVFNGNLAGQSASSLIPGADGAPVSALTRLLTIFVLSLLGIVISSLLSMIWPRSVASAAKAISLAPDRAAALGLIWFLISSIVLSVIAAILVLSLIGLAVLPLAILLAQVPYLAGLAVAGRALGEKLGLQGFTAQIAGAALILLPALMIAPLSMVVAFICFYILAGIGIGGLILLRVSVAYRNSALA